METIEKDIWDIISSNKTRAKFDIDRMYMKAERQQSHYKEQTEKLYNDISYTLTHILNPRENDFALQRKYSSFSSIRVTFAEVIHRIILRKSIKINSKKSTSYNVLFYNAMKLEIDNKSITTKIHAYRNRNVY